MRLLIVEFRVLLWLALAWITGVLVITGARYGFAPALVLASSRAWRRWRRRRRALEEASTCL